MGKKEVEKSVGQAFSPRPEGGLRAGGQPAEPEKEKITVTVVQAHREPGDTGGFVERAVGDEIEIAAAEFCENLHKKRLMIVD